jgi:hypothetical protein
MKTRSIILGLLSSLVVSHVAFAASPPNSQNTINYSTNMTATVESDMASVLVTIDATATTKDSHTAQMTAIQTLKTYLPKVDWQVVNIKQTQAASGAENVEVQLQAQIQQSDVSSLTRKISNAKVANQKMSLVVLNYDPSDEALSKMEQGLMIQLYKNIQQYAANFNRETRSNYRIQSVRFSTMTPRIQPLLLARGGAPTAVRDQNSMDVSSKKLKLTAYVTLQEEPTPATNDDARSRPMVGGQGSLPPAYLKVKGFKACMGEKDMGTWRSICLPSAKPSGCAQSSWQQLQAMKITAC